MGIEVKERELLKTDIESLRGTVEKVKDALEEVFCGMRELLSAMEVGEELGENKKVDAVLEAPTPSLLNSHLVVVKKIKAQQLWVPLGEVQPLFQVVEHCAPPLYTGRAGGFGLLVYAETFKSPYKPCSFAFGLDVGVDGIILSGLEMGKLNSLTIHPSTAECTPHSREPFTSLTDNGCTSHCVAQ